MEQVLKEKLFFWLFNNSSQEEFEADNYYEIERLIKLKAIDELTRKLLRDQRIIWNIGSSDVIILKVFLNIGSEKMLTTYETAKKLNTTQSIVHNSLCKTKSIINQEINRRKIMNMPKGDILDLYVSDINLSNRAVTALLNNNIFEVSDLVELTKQDLKALKYMGHKTTNEIINTVHSFGLVFKGEIQYTTEEEVLQRAEAVKERLYNIDQQQEYLKYCRQESIEELNTLCMQLERLSKRKNLARK